MSCLLLAYSSYAVPMQLSFWDREDPCNPFPTLYIDIFVDSFFIVRAIARPFIVRATARPPLRTRGGLTDQGRRLRPRQYRLARSATTFDL